MGAVRAEAGKAVVDTSSVKEGLKQVIRHRAEKTS